jgi:TolB-like protein
MPRALAGESDRLKEYVIGVEVFDRDEQYGPRAAYAPGTRPRDIAAALEATVLIEARVLSEGEHVRVEARATGAAEQKLWVETFVGVAADSDSLAREVAAAIGDRLGALQAAGH